MGKKRIGLDVGTSSLKAVIVEETLRGLRATQCREVGFRLGTNLAERQEAFAEAVYQLIPEGELRKADVIAAVPSHLMSWHGISLPFARAGHIAKVVKYEIAQHVPFDPEEVVSDFFMPTAEKRREALVRVACVPREQLLAFRTLLHSAAVSPASLTAEALAMYYSYLAQGRGETEGGALLIDIGASKTTLCLVRSGGFLGAGCIYQGGDWVTRRLGEEAGIPFEEAEEVKLSPDSKHEPALDRAYNGFLSSLGDSVERCLLAPTMTQEEPERVDGIVLSGGCARVQRVSDYLAKRLALPVRPANPFEGLPSTFFVPTHVAGSVYQIAAGLALERSYRGRARLDLQRPLMERREAEVNVRGKLVPLGVGVLAVVLLAMGNLSYKLYAKERQHRVLTEHVNSVFSAAFPNVPPPADAKNQMRAQVQYAEDELKSIEGMAAPKRMLDMLRELTVLLPAELDLLITDLSFADQQMRLQGETVSFDAVDMLRARLSESGRFHDAVINAANANKRTGRITFTVSASY